MKAEEFDAKFDQDEDITNLLDLSKTHRPGYEQKQINITFPIWMIETLEQEAKRLGVSFDSLIKLWLAERLDQQTLFKSKKAS